MNCVCATGQCPVAKGECDADGECYIWRCENPNAPKPEPEVKELDEIVNIARSVA